MREGSTTGAPNVQAQAELAMRLLLLFVGSRRAHCAHGGWIMPTAQADLRYVHLMLSPQGSSPLPHVRARMHFNLWSASSTPNGSNWGSWRDLVPGT